MSSRNHTLGGSRFHNGSSLIRQLADPRRFTPALVYSTLVFACGGKPGIDYESEANGGTKPMTATPTAGSGLGPNFNAGGSSNANTVPEEPSICGNGKLESKELCDDGNVVDGDGCSATCLIRDLHFDCSKPGQACVRWVICGNGKIEGDEVCDDANTASGDGCKSDCSGAEPGFACAKPGVACVALPKCGNGIRERGEGCDDGEVVPDNGDGCSSTCQTEAGFVCAVPGQPCIKEVCGDGSRSPSEQCDDSNAISNDGCSERCQIETGWRCNSLGCSAICGDGLIVNKEQCDDGNHNAGDGCSAACLTEPFYNCVGQPSICNSTIICGNSVREPGEVCDPPGQNGCRTGCKEFDSDFWSGTTKCNNSIIELGESCDPPAVGNGCSATCQVEEGWVCPRPGLCSKKPFCGDGQVDFNLGETCDVGAVSSAGCIGCVVAAGWDCHGLKPSTCVTQVCGDGILASNEECDDKNAIPNDGCTSCKIDPGWVCPVVGTACRARCGDKAKVGTEQCDDGNLTNSDGCNAGCSIEPGYNCPTAGVACVASQCPNGAIEAGESCDIGDTIAGDGCGPTCLKEPTVTVGPNPTVNLTCGDGLLTLGEQCDDGNTSSGDGCSATCTEEAGFKCDSQLKLPTYVDFAVTHRDFKGCKADADGTDTGCRNISGSHPDFQYGMNKYPLGIVGPVCTRANAAACGRLDAEGKPQLYMLDRAATLIKNADTFKLWFRDTNAAGIKDESGSTNIAISSMRKTLRLTQVASGSQDYSLTDDSFFPLDSQGLGNEGRTHNYHFTTEFRYFFQYRGGETLTFKGDDDVWVFINGGLAVDIGGVHQQRYGRVVLGDDGTANGASSDSNCSVQSQLTLPDAAGCYDATEQADNVDDRFGLVKGRVYEIVFFHAERHTTESNFQLTLSGFLAPRSYCRSTCGDGILVAGEVCDDGANNADNVSGRCNKSCTQLAYCGDGITQQGEACDNGKNTDLYVNGTRTTQCSPGCVLPPTCGDGVAQGSEQCDNGAANDDASYGMTSCTTKCLFGGYCGDGIKNGTEVCDAGAKNGASYGEGSCGYDCKSGPYYCGDGVRNGNEECDEGPTGGVNCSASCKLTPYCGDGVKSEGEACDYGKFASTAYGSCTAQCIWSSICGDKVVNAPYEECDAGTEGNLGAYGGCTATCILGPRCGDGFKQEDKGEQCDNGYNQDTYEYVAGACGRNCLRPPYCGDGNVMPGYELCDNGTLNSDTAYQGCTSRCEWGPYCGDGKIDPQGGETCDNGRDNVLWGVNSSACGFDCRVAPYCGDGERNGPEQCDLGIAGNTGAYGTCNPDCTMAIRCGDRIVQGSEECDDGPTGSLECTSSCARRLGTII